jgi:hypothetical protein
LTAIVKKLYYECIKDNTYVSKRSDRQAIVFVTYAIVLLPYCPMPC